MRSWASSLSLESQSDEATAAAVEFMRKYVTDLFSTPGDISLEQKAKFGQLAQVRTQSADQKRALIERLDLCRGSRVSDGGR